MAPKDQIAPNESFSRKTTNKIFMYLSAHFILQKLKKNSQPVQNYEDVPFSSPKWPICPEQNFFGTNHYYRFHLPIGLLAFFTVQNFKKFLRQIQSYEDALFLGVKWSIAPTPTPTPLKKKIGKLLISFSSTY